MVPSLHPMVLQLPCPSWVEGLKEAGSIQKERTKQVTCNRHCRPFLSDSSLSPYYKGFSASPGLKNPLETCLKGGKTCPPSPGESDSLDQELTKESAFFLT